MIERLQPWKRERELRLAHALRGVPLLREVPAADLLAIWRRLREVAVPAGTVLCRRGDPGDRLYLIQAGAVAVQLQHDGGQIVLRRLGPGDVVGEMALLTGQPRSADVVAVEETRLWALERDDFDTLASTNMPLLRTLNRALCDLVVHMTTLVEEQVVAQQRQVAGLQIGPYRVVEQIGAGGMGVVYRAVHQTSGRTAAVKVLPATWGRAVEFLERLRREAAALRRIDHPNVIHMYEVDEVNGHLGSATYLAMEWLPDALDRIMWASYPEPLAAQTALRFAHGVATGLAAIHQAELVHRDIKPSNILLRENGTPVLIDFGLVTSGIADSSSRLTASNVIVGSADYMAPEQVAGLPLDGRADLYALGVTLYEMLAGYVPFAGKEPLATLQAHVSEAVPPLPAHVPGPARAIVEQALQKRPGDRFASAAAMAAALAAAMEAV